ncbi:MAG: substrate-binding domain-containing protein [Bacteroidales bacterium]|nr:substrate-binding domain-containing protein [Bacteroidales bacterium]
MIKILLLTDYSQESERRFLNGFVKYADTQGGCIFYPTSHLISKTKDNSMEIIRMAKRFKVDAILGLWHNVNVEEARKLNIPIFLRTHKKVYEEFPMLTGHYKSFGAYAADFFINQNFSNYAFIGMKDIIWSMSRFEGYSEQIDTIKKVKTHRYDVEDFKNEIEPISKWLHSLPKPIALFACNDFMARQVTEICQMENIRIPEDISLLGVDNDEFMCNISSPTISSIKLNFEKHGYELSSTLFKMVREKKIWPARIAVEAIGVVERMSTKRKIISDPYIREIVDFISRNYTQEIDISKLTSFIPLSRRAIEMKFKKEMYPYTITSYIMELRLKHFCNLLETTDLPIRTAADRSGFIDSSNFSTIFRKYKGMTPTEYRKISKV